MEGPGLQILLPIEARAFDRLVDHDDWFKAMLTICWIRKSGIGFALTTAGRQVLEDIRAERARAKPRDGATMPAHVG